MKTVNIELTEEEAKILNDILNNEEYIPNGSKFGFVAEEVMSQINRQIDFFE